jgi:hypothetical protein
MGIFNRFQKQALSLNESAKSSAHIKENAYQFEGEDFYDCMEVRTRTRVPGAAILRCFLQLKSAETPSFNQSCIIVSFYASGRCTCVRCRCCALLMTSRHSSTLCMTGATPTHVFRSLDKV